MRIDQISNEDLIAAMSVEVAIMLVFFLSMRYRINGYLGVGQSTYLQSVHSAI